MMKVVGAYYWRPLPWVQVEWHPGGMVQPFTVRIGRRRPDRSLHLPWGDFGIYRVRRLSRDVSDPPPAALPE